MDFKSTKGIKFKVVLTGTIMIAAVVSITATYLIRSQTTYLKEEFKKRAIALTENFARNINYPLLLEDVQSIDNLTLSMMKNEDVAGIVLKNAAGKVLFREINKDVPDVGQLKSAAMPEEMSMAGNDQFLFVSLPVLFHQEQAIITDYPVSEGSRKTFLGQVTVGFSQDRRNALIRKTIINSTIIAFAVLGIALFMLVFLLNRFINPLLMLVEAIREVSAGKLYHRVAIRRKDEIGELADAFNDMAENMEANRKLLENYNQVLEEKVRQRTEALSESESRYRAVFEATGTAMVIIAEDGTISMVNEEFENMSGMKREELEKKKKWMDFINSDDLAKMQDYEKLRKTSGRSMPRSYELKTIPINGKVKNVYLTISLLPGGAKKIGSIIDVSERRRLEYDLQQAQKLEAIGTLAGGIAHDFNNLLMGIQGYASLILLDMESNHEHFGQLRKIEELVRSGSGLTKQILGFARGGKYEIKPVNLNDIIEKSSSMFGRTKKEIRIEKRYQQDLWIVDADRGQIEQVFLNLYVNAWHAMPGGGELYLESANVIMDEDYASAFSVRPGRYVKVSVTDTGIGMDDKTRQRIFEPFFTTREMGRGTGLGLAMVYGIINGHNGMITVYSEKGQGTSFHLYFPVSDKEVIKEKLQEDAISLGHESILIVDDEEEIRTVSGDMLRRLGYHVFSAGSGLEALEIYKKERSKIDLVILDMIMPDMGGEETFQCLKNIDPEVKVILSSGYSLNSQAGRIMEGGCLSFLQKPFTISELSQNVRGAFN